MLFIEFRFFFFFLLVFGVAWVLRNNAARKSWLLLSSYVFYGAWDWRFLSLILTSTFVDFVVGIRLEATKPTRRRYWLLLSLLTNLGLLGFFKYFNFFVESAGAFFEFMGMPLSWNVLHVVLPIGISFYTFQTLSYTIDVYRRNIPATRNRLDFAFFVAFFPQLVAGPIVRASEFLPQLPARPVFSATDFRAAVMLFWLGFFKKTCIADNVAPFVDRFFEDPTGFDAIASVGASLSFWIQWYCDFSGYSEMAIAMAAMLGYRLAPNFNHPFLAGDFKQFWRTSHMSLYRWIRDYVYIPLEKRRDKRGGGRLVQHGNLILTFLLSGLWHGAGFTYIAFGGIHGVFLAGERALKGPLKRVFRFGPRIRFIAGWLVTMYLLNLTALIFRAPDISTALTAMRIFLTMHSPGTATTPGFIWAATALLLPLHYLCARTGFLNRVSRLPPLAYGLLLGVFLALTAALMQVDYRPFVYFQF